MDNTPTRILLVDDEPALLDLMKIYLRRLGYPVVTSGNTDHAWQTFAESPGNFAVAVIDGTLAGAGMEVLAAQMLAANPRMGVIACSGYPVDVTVLEAAAPGRVGFLPKPFTPDELTAAVRRMLAEKKKTFDLGKEIKAIARERVGTVPAVKPIEPKSMRKKPKHKKAPEDELL